MGFKKQGTIIIEGAKTRPQMAEELGISVPTLWREFKKYDVMPPMGKILPYWQIKIYTAFFPDAMRRMKKVGDGLWYLKL